MYIHYIWIGGEIPRKYKTNIDICTKLNPGYQVMLWRDQDIDRLLMDCDEEVRELYYKPRNFINKYALIKYTILNKFPGVYTDLDIRWKTGFTKIQQDQNKSNKPLILTYGTYTKYTLNGISRKVVDDPFLIANVPNLMGECIEYRKQRDGIERIDELTNEVHEVEPIGILLLNEWLYNNEIPHSAFDQVGYLDGKGYYGEHEAKATWSVSEASWLTR